MPFATPKHHATEGWNDLKKHVPRGLTSLLDSGINKAIAAAGPAAAAGAAGAGAASLQNAPFATPKHHATEGWNDLQKHVPRSLTSLLDSGINKAIAAAGPAAAAAPAAAAGAATRGGAASLQNAPVATPRHHATEIRNDFKKHAAPGLDVPSGFW